MSELRVVERILQKYNHPTATISTLNLHIKISLLSELFQQPEVVLIRACGVSLDLVGLSLQQKVKVKVHRTQNFIHSAVLYSKVIGFKIETSDVVLLVSPSCVCGWVTLSGSGRPVVV